MFIFLKGIFKKIGGWKYAGVSRPYCSDNFPNFEIVRIKRTLFVFTETKMINDKKVFQK